MDTLIVIVDLALLLLVWYLAPPRGWWPSDALPGSGLRARIVRWWRR